MDGEGARLLCTMGAAAEMVGYQTARFTIGIGKQLFLTNLAR
jgi:hypothetical protein